MGCSFFEPLVFLDSVLLVEVAVVVEDEVEAALVRDSVVLEVAELEGAFALCLV